MLPFKMTEAQFTASSDEIKSHYKRSGDGYVLETIGDHPQVTGLQNQLAQAGVNIANLQQANLELTGKVTVAEQNAETKYKADLEAATAKLTKLQNKLQEDTRTSEVNAIAGRFTQSELFVGTLENRIKTEINKDGTVGVKYFNKDGQEVERQVLHDEFLKNTNYSAMLKKDGVPVVNNQPASSAPTTNPTSGQPQGQPTTAVWGTGADGKVFIDMGRASDKDVAAAIAAQNAQQA